MTTDTPYRGAGTHSLTAKQRQFVELYAVGESARSAAKLAGYSEHVANNATRDVLGSSAVREALATLRQQMHAETRARIVAGAIKAAKLLEEVVDDPDSPTRERVRAAIALLDRSGHEPRAEDETPGWTELDEMLAAAD